MATEFKARIESFSAGISTNLTDEQFKEKIKELQDIIKEYESKNNDLSSEYDKDQNSGRFASKLHDFKKQLTEIKSEKPVTDEEDISSKQKSIF